MDSSEEILNNNVMTITYEERLKNVEFFSLKKRRLQQAITTAFKYAKGQCKE